MILSVSLSVIVSSFAAIAYLIYISKHHFFIVFFTLFHYSIEMVKTIVLSVGGSIVAPDGPDLEFISKFKSTVEKFLAESRNTRLVFIVGGGGPARQYQQTYRAITGTAANSSEQDWIGIMATRLNARLIKGIFGELCKEDVVTDPSSLQSFKGRVLVAAGWKPGFSTDNDAVVLAENLGADTVINLSNVAKVYSADPKTDPDAVPLDSLSWKEMQHLVGETWIPGKNVPFDPVATKKAAELGLTVIAAEGRNIQNLEKILKGEAFYGTTIGPQ